MYRRKGGGWLTEGRLAVLIIYEAFALAQCALGVGMSNRGIRRQTGPQRILNPDL
jgi:hypothetical protein